MIPGAPWQAELTQPEYMLASYFLAIAALAMFAGFMRAWITRGEVGSRYRMATVARLCLSGVAFLSYLVINLQFQLGWLPTGDTYTPNSHAIFAFALRYADWSITVPLLVVELIAVCAISGAVARRTRAMAMGSAFLMIFTGYLGGVVIGDGRTVSQLLLWGAISVGFYAVTIIVLVGAVRNSLPQLTPAAAGLLSAATIVLFGGWLIYPIVYSIQVFAFGGAWTTTMLVSYSAADIVVKIGFGGLIHRVAKLRTAEDVRAGDDVHPESIWVSSEKLSDAGVPPEVYLADGAAIHGRRARPTDNFAVSSDVTPSEDDQ